MVVALIVISVLLLLFLLFTEELYRYVFCKKSSKLFSLLFDAKGHEQGYYDFKNKTMKELSEKPVESFSIKSDRGQKLKGFYYENGAKGKRIAFMVHGYRADHLYGVSGFYDYYKSRGIDIFAPDHTASGESEGNFIGFDVFETEDCLKWVAFLIEKFGKDTELLLHGFSMGAATVMKMSDRVPENVKFIIEDSGYQNAKASLHHQVGPMYTPLRLINKAVARYDLNASDVTESLKKATLPILFVHGKDDKLVPYENGPKLFALYGGEKDCFFPERTRHVEAIYTDEKGYAEKTDKFINTYFKTKKNTEEKVL